MHRIRTARFVEDGHRYFELTENVPDGYAGQERPSVTKVCKSVGLFNFDGVPDDGRLEQKADLGTEVHYVTALLDRGENLDDYNVDPRVLPWVDSYRELKVVQNWTPLAVEYGPCIADVNGMPVGFRFDRMGLWDGEEAVLELKTTTADDPYHGVQLAGYDLCLGERRRLRLVARLRGDGKLAKVKPYTDPSEYGVFTWALGITHWKRNKQI